MKPAPQTAFALALAATPAPAASPGAGFPEVKAAVDYMVTIVSR